MYRSISIAAMFILGLGCLNAQEDKPVHDSTIMVRDSIIYNSLDEVSYRNDQDSVKYHNIATMSGRSKFWKAVHRALFRRLEKESKPRLSADQISEALSHQRGQGRIIRNIKILSFDPFGYNIRDTSKNLDRVVFDIGNAIHAKTNNPVIRNLILFSEFERYDSLLVKESQRLIRSQDYIRDVSLMVSRVSRDSVDVSIRTLDVWSLLPSAKITGSQTGFGLKDLNFAGTGNTLQLNTLWKHNRGNITHVSWLMPNIRNTYTSLNVQYLFSPGNNVEEIQDFDNYYYSPVSSNPQYMFSANRNIIRSIEVNRPFYSPRTRWAGGAFLGQIMTAQSFIDLDSIRVLSQRTNINDIWAGRSWQLFRDREDERITSLVLSGRFVRATYHPRLPEAETFDIFNNLNYYFGALSITSRKYFQDRYVFNYGITEDVPGGKIAGITLGTEFRQKRRLYIGLNAGTGTYYSFGYLSAHLSYGTFADASGFHQGLLTGRLTYFTKLMTIGNWKLRQFIRPSFAFGINRSPVDNQPLSIGIRGFESIETRSPSLTLISLQTQTYAPWNLAGFHFGPYLFLHAGRLGAEPLGHKGRLYSLLGIGVLIRNEYLMFNTFQISVSFYPYIPENRHNLFRTNAYKTTDYGFRDFEVTKPGIIE